MFNVIFHPKKYKSANFHEDWSYRTQDMTISLDTENSKQWISEKKTLKLPKFQKPKSMGDMALAH